MPNTAIDLAKIDKNLPISVSGKVGDDEHGRFILSELSRYGIDCERVVVSSISGAPPRSGNDLISSSFSYVPVLAACIRKTR